MRIGGFQKLSLVDYPGKISCIVFTIGCNLRCGYCYVPQLVLPERIRDLKEVPEGEIFSFLERNKGLNDAVVVTGGEPTIHRELPSFMERIKRMGFLVALETNGTNPDMLEGLIEERLVDYVEMDVKTALEFEKYQEITGGVLTEEMFENIKESIKVLLRSEVDYEFRTTLVKEYHSVEDILEICRALKGAKAYYLQNLRVMNELVGGKALTPFSREEIEKIVAEGRKMTNVRFRE